MLKLLGASILGIVGFVMTMVTFDGPPWAAYLAFLIIGIGYFLHEGDK